MIPSTWKKVKPSGNYYRNVRKELNELLTNKKPVRIVRLSPMAPNQISSTTKDDESPIATTAATFTANDENNTATIIESASVADPSQINDGLLPSTSSSSFRHFQHSGASMNDSSDEESNDSLGLCTSTFNKNENKILFE